MSAESELADNIRRLRDWNRELAARRWQGGDDPPPPVLRAGGIEVSYAPSRTEPTLRHPNPPGAGPDESGYYLSAADPDGYSVGDLFHSQRTGGVYCRVETPVAGGGFAARWLRIT